MHSSSTTEIMGVELLIVFYSRVVGCLKDTLHKFLMIRMTD